MKTIQFLSNIQMLLFFFIIFFGVYQFIIFMFSFFKRPIDEIVFGKNHRFMAVIPARNEEKVILNLIKSLKNQGYPEELLDIYVIADNCTDNTAKIARKAGAIVYERFNELHKSKGFALEWFFNIVLSEFPDKYDAFCVFDADNIVASNFIYKMNEKLCQGELIVQGYRDIKNASDNCITANYALFYWIMNRFYHLARYNLGLSPLINGTGFMVAMSVIKETNGWHTETLTEDIEFSLNLIAKGYKIGWAKDAIVYDEQPTSFKQSWQQRMRWSVGHIQCIKACLPNILSNQYFSTVLIDAIIYLLGMPMILLSLIVTILDIIKFIIAPFKYQFSIIGRLKFSIILVLVIILQGVFISLIEKKNIKKVWKGIATYPIFLVSWYLINIVAFFNLKMQWKTIDHVKSVEINEVQ